MAERQQLLEDICLRALEIDPLERAAFLREVCTDEELKAEAESLLAASGYADTFFRVPLALQTVADDAMGKKWRRPTPGRRSVLTGCWSVWGKAAWAWCIAPASGSRYGAKWR